MEKFDDHFNYIEKQLGMISDLRGLFYLDTIKRFIASLVEFLLDNNLSEKDYNKYMEKKSKRI